MDPFHAAVVVVVAVVAEDIHEDVDPSACHCTDALVDDSSDNLVDPCVILEDFALGDLDDSDTSDVKASVHHLLLVVVAVVVDDDGDRWEESCISASSCSLVNS